MKKLVILFSGEGSNLENLICRFQNSVAIYAITNRPNAGGIARAKTYGVNITVIDHTHYKSRETFDAELLRTVQSHAPDLVVMAGFMRILTPVFTSGVKAINLHPSLLPLFKGGRAIEESFESSEPLGGVSVHWVTHELDGGAVIAQEAFDKEPGETLESFTEKIRAIEHDLLPRAIDALLKETLS